MEIREWQQHGGWLLLSVLLMDLWLFQFSTQVDFYLQHRCFSKNTNGFNHRPLTSTAPQTHSSNRCLQMFTDGMYVQFIEATQTQSVCVSVCVQKTHIHCSFNWTELKNLLFLFWWNKLRSQCEHEAAAPPRGDTASVEASIGFYR